jgi:hypothetical protein
VCTENNVTSEWTCLCRDLDKWLFTVTHIIHCWYMCTVTYSRDKLPKRLSKIHVALFSVMTHAVRYPVQAFWAAFISRVNVTFWYWVLAFEAFDICRVNLETMVLTASGKRCLHLESRCGHFDTEYQQLGLLNSAEYTRTIWYRVTTI